MKFITAINLPGIKRSYANHRFILFAILLILCVRLLFIGIMGLMPQDAYYQFYSEHLALSYFDHPPGLAYILRFFTAVFGKKVFVLKLADSLVTIFSILAFYQLASLFLSTHAAKKALILFFSTLMVTLISLVSTPDVPLILFWTLSLLTLYHAIFLKKKIYWIWSGIMMGLSFDSKYTGLFLPVGLILFLILSGSHRKWLLSVWFWLCQIFFIITISPVVIWNVENDFASFRFQSSERLSGINALHINVVNFLGVLGHQAAILIPVLLFSLIFFLFKSFKKYLIERDSISSQQLFLFCFFIPVFIGFLSISFIYWVKLNWMMPAYISGIILISSWFKARWIRYQLITSLVIHLVLIVEIVFYPLIIKSDDTWIGWGALAGKVRELKTAYSTDFVFSADDYKTSAVLNFYLDSMVYARNVIDEPALQFDFVGTNLNTLKGKDALFINSIPNFKTDQKENQFPPKLPLFFDTVTEIQPILIKKGGHTIRKFLVFYCKNYHPENKSIEKELTTNKR